MRSAGTPEKILVILILILVLFVRVRLLTAPLERDEGEYAYAGQLLLQGVPPFKEAYNMKMPGIYAAYAVCMAVFGQTIAGVHLGLLAVNAISTALLFLLVRKYFDGATAATSAAMFAVLAVSESVLGVFAHATHFVVVFSLLGYWYLGKAIESKKWLDIAVSGLSLGLAFTMKQHAAPLIALAGVALVWRVFRTEGTKRTGAAAAVFGAGVMVPFLVIVLVTFISGSFDTFWFWTFDYARAYVGQVPLSTGAPKFFTESFERATFDGAIWLLGLGGVAAVLRLPSYRAVRGPLLLIAAASWAAIWPGLYFREHYYVLVLPITSVFAAIGVVTAADIVQTARLYPHASHVRAAIVAIAVVVSFVTQWSYCFALSPVDVTRKIYGIAPFEESIPIADYVAKHTEPTDRIAVLGSEPQIYFYAKRRAATGYLYMYPLMEIQPHAKRMQDELIEEIQRNRPEYIVFVSSVTSWLYKKSSDIHVLDWFNEYSRTEYRVVGFMERLRNGQTQALWDDDAPRMKPASTHFVVILKRKDAGAQG